MLREMANALGSLKLLALYVSSTGIAAIPLLRAKFSDRDLKQTVEHKQLLKIKHLLQVAEERSPYYRDKFARQSVHAAEISSFEEFRSRIPILEKVDLANNQQAILTRPVAGTVRRDTAGSTGHPRAIYLDNRSVIAQRMIRHHCQSWHGVRFGAPEARFWGRRDRSWRSAAKDWILNRKTFRLFSESKHFLDAEVSSFNRFRPVCVYGYPSLIARFARYVLASGQSLIGPSVVITTAEAVTSSDRSVIEKAFGCKSVVEYGCSEVDIIAHECEVGGLHVVADRVYLEIEGDGGEGDVIITDLDNLAFPIIRYRLGDFASIDRRNCECGRNWELLRALIGRTSDRFIIRPDGSSTHAVVLAHIVEDINRDSTLIQSFRVDQVSEREVHFFVELASADNRKAIKQRLKDEFSERVSTEIEVSVRFESPRLVDDSKAGYFRSLASIKRVAD